MEIQLTVADDVVTQSTIVFLTFYCKIIRVNRTHFEMNDHRIACKNQARKFIMCKYPLKTKKKKRFRSKYQSDYYWPISYRLRCIIKVHEKHFRRGQVEVNEVQRIRMNLNIDESNATDSNLNERRTKPKRNKK